MTSTPRRASTAASGRRLPPTVRLWLVVIGVTVLVAVGVVELVLRAVGW